MPTQDQPLGCIIFSHWATWSELDSDIGAWTRLHIQHLKIVIHTTLSLPNYSHSLHLQIQYSNATQRSPKKQCWITQARNSTKYKHQHVHEFVQVQQKLYSQAAQILTAIKTTKVREAGERQWILSLAEEVVSYTRRKGFVRSRFLSRLQREFVYRGQGYRSPISCWIWQQNFKCGQRKWSSWTKSLARARWSASSSHSQSGRITLSATPASLQILNSATPPLTGGRDSNQLA